MVEVARKPDFEALSRDTLIPVMDLRIQFQDDFSLEEVVQIYKERKDKLLPQAWNLLRGLVAERAQAAKTIREARTIFFLVNETHERYAVSTAKERWRLLFKERYDAVLTLSELVALKDEGIPEEDQREYFTRIISLVQTLDDAGLVLKAFGYWQGPSINELLAKKLLSLLICFLDESKGDISKMKEAQDWGHNLPRNEAHLFSEKFEILLEEKVEKAQTLEEFGLLYEFVRYRKGDGLTSTLVFRWTRLWKQRVATAEKFEEVSALLEQRPPCDECGDVVERRMLELATTKDQLWSVISNHEGTTEVRLAAIDRYCRDFAEFEPLLETLDWLRPSEGLLVKLVELAPDREALMRLKPSFERLYGKIKDLYEARWDSLVASVVEGVSDLDSALTAYAVVRPWSPAQNAVAEKIMVFARDRLTTCKTSPELRKLFEVLPDNLKFKKEVEGLWFDMLDQEIANAGTRESALECYRNSLENKDLRTESLKKLVTFY